MNTIKKTDSIKKALANIKKVSEAARQKLIEQQELTENNPE